MKLTSQATASEDMVSFCNFSNTQYKILLISHNILAAQPKKFYKNTGILSCAEGKYEITLDQRKLKTPRGNLFTVNSEPLAIAIATEWDAQKEKINQSTMHLVRIFVVVEYF
jgi:chaperone required for assembly of F1-ATPase